DQQRCSDRRMESLFHQAAMYNIQSLGGRFPVDFEWLSLHMIYLCGFERKHSYNFLLGSGIDHLNQIRNNITDIVHGSQTQINKITTIIILGVSITKGSNIFTAKDRSIVNLD